MVNPSSATIAWHNNSVTDYGIAELNAVHERPTTSDANETSDVNEPLESLPLESLPPGPDSRRWEIVLGYREHITRLVRSRLWNPQDVDDCVQEVILRAVLFQRLDEDRAGAFLTSAALRLCVDYYRDRDRQRRLRLRVAYAERSAGPEEIICETDLGHWMLELVQQLQGRERQVMLARAQGMTNRQIADRYCLSAKAVESAFTRGRARLRSLYERSMADSHHDSCP